jgi:hypothetical protein
MPNAPGATKKTSDAPIHVLGVRHHGPGSARSVLRALETIEPDTILVEGPPDADALLPLLLHEEMKPPVALLIHAADRPREAVYYPFAVFSPEWQALHFGLTRGVPVRFMDLPQAFQLGLPESDGKETAHDAPTSSDREPSALQLESPSEIEPDERSLAARIRHDPLSVLAELAGFSDGERWWEFVVEHRRDGADVFAAVRDAMAALREDLPVHDGLHEARREAHMRQTIRAARRAGAKNIAVVCGAWHAPALATLPRANDDEAILKGLPKGRVKAAWVPWTYSRLSYASGYGAGIESPGWYHHLWNSSDRIVNRWMTRVARLLRDEGLDASPAHVIESVRLAETLAALRRQPLPGLIELDEAILAVFCFGNSLPLRLIREKLVVGEALGQVPAETPSVPLQQDLEREQKRLRLPADPGQKLKELDLRDPTDLARSHLLHRLDLLDIAWGELRHATGKGTFKEVWHLQWRPEFAVSLIEAAIWGNTVQSAADARARDLANNAPDLPALTRLLDRALLAELADAVRDVMDRLAAEAALASDVTHLMGALPPLANVLRYGDVRKTDTTQVGHVVDGLVARVCIGMPVACASLNDDAAEEMFGHLLNVNAAISLLQVEEQLRAWRSALRDLADRAGVHGLLAGRACRLLLDAGQITSDEAARRLGLALSKAAEPARAAAWIEGLLKDSGLILLHDEALWSVLDAWVASIPVDAFAPTLPLIRRTFSAFPSPERSKLGERAKRGPAAPLLARSDEGAFHEERAKAVLPLIARLLGITPEAKPEGD